MTGHLPSGTVTFLLTDLEGSTRMWEQDPEAMKPAMVREAVSYALANIDPNLVTGPMASIDR